MSLLAWQGCIISRGGLLRGREYRTTPWRPGFLLHQCCKLLDGHSTCTCSFVCWLCIPTLHVHARTV
ncbi:hypothetical protein TRIATDRAFT_299387, partial [Trichoderma atroviride IMI 206040]